MADRAVYRTGKNDGDITSLCNADAAWSPRSKSGAIGDIESGTHTYYVPWTSGRTEVRVVQGSRGKYLALTAMARRGTTSTTCPTADACQISRPSPK